MRALRATCHDFRVSPYAARHIPRLPAITSPALATCRLLPDALPAVKRLPYPRTPPPRVAVPLVFCMPPPYATMQALVYVDYHIGWTVEHLPFYTLLDCSIASYPFAGFPLFLFVPGTPAACFLWFPFAIYVDLRYYLHTYHTLPQPLHIIPTRTCGLCIRLNITTTC